MRHSRGAEAEAAARATGAEAGLAGTAVAKLPVEAEEGRSAGWAG